MASVILHPQPPLMPDRRSLFPNRDRRRAARTVREVAVTQPEERAVIERVRRTRKQKQTKPNEE